MMRLASEDMTSLWKAATGTLLHGPRCTCVGFGMMHRSRAELERDIAEFLIAKYEDQKKAGIANLMQRWVDEHAVDPARSSDASVVPARNEGLPEWIDRNAPSMNITDDDLRQIGADIRALLQSMAAPASEFVCR
jgi:hypothetical protein